MYPLIVVLVKRRCLGRLLAKGRGICRYLHGGTRRLGQKQQLERWTCVIFMLILYKGILLIVKEEENQDGS